jgi:plasmid stabilization system protein ParE
MVIWTARARADLKAIHDYIAKDAPLNAKTVVRELLRKADTLTDLPQLGRVVPELNDVQLREIPCYSWRILYHLRHGRIYIVTLVHKRRQLGAEEITGR